jgi:hypothetical protein
VQYLDLCHDHLDSTALLIMVDKLLTDNGLTCRLGSQNSLKDGGLDELSWHWHFVCPEDKGS